MSILCKSNKWVLETCHTAYVFGLDSTGLLLQLYWGAKLPNFSDYPDPPKLGNFEMASGASHFLPEEYPAYGGINYVDPCLKVSFADGTRDTVLRFVDDSISKTTIPELIVRLKDDYYPLQVSLHYRVYEEFDLIERWVVLENLGSTPIQVERVFSAKWTVPQGRDYSLNHLFGRQMDEFHIQREPLTPGLKTYESRRIIPGHNTFPWFALDHAASEDQGEVWFGTLAWSGNFRVTAEVTEFSSTRVSIGLNDWDFGWKLLPSEPLETPPALAGYTKQGFGAASRSLHEYVREQLLPHGKIQHKVLYNSWEATTFNVDEPSQSKLAEIAAGLGVELFVMDDGWFHKRVLDNAGLGDWWPDEIKFSSGLDGLIKKVNDLGMDFGLWVEPEMVNPDSDLYRRHPDWVIHFPARTRSESRNQLILNMARPDVQEYVLNILDKLLTENNIAFIKWDMNRSASQPGWPEAPGDQRELWVRYIRGVYSVWGELRQRHPKVIWQSCSSGGGRTDYGILHYADQVWTSDNTEATSRLNIQEGISQYLPAVAMEAWVTDWNEGFVPLEFRFHVSMCGSLGVGGNLLKWSESDRELAKKCIDLYKEIRSTIQFGQQYRLISPQKQDYSALQYVSQDQSKSVLFAFRVHIPEKYDFPIIRLRGLIPDALYTVEGEPSPRSGLSWMEAGLTVELKNLQSKILRIQRVH